ncbi:hypothetical protein [Candidatus Uabimicrobium sp. HlEnr_7]|uniref:hypothetical protein n=1 Tax=Candidatus Uabimicrobium helgolandensis TaxID=3095367 RepID=UPI003558C3CB
MKYLYYFCVLFFISMIQAQEQKTAITSYSVITQKYAKEVVVNNKTYNKSFIITIHGEFPTTNFQFFIGSYHPKNATVTAKKIEFKVYDQDLLYSLKNQRFAYRIGQGELHDYKSKFTLRTSTPQKENVALRACRVTQKTLRKPISQGKSTYTNVYVISIDADLPNNYAIPVDIFVGDYQITEYGGTSTGIYFHIYNPQQLVSLNGKPIAYGYENKKWEISPVTLQVPNYLLDRVLEKK